MKTTDRERTYLKSQENDLRWLASQVARLAELRELRATAPSKDAGDDITSDMRRIVAALNKRFGERLAKQIVLRATTHIGALHLEER